MSQAQCRGNGPAVVEIALADFSGAAAYLDTHADDYRLDEHHHDWPTLTLPIVGCFTASSEDGERWIGGPAALFHPAGHAHAASIGATGLESINIQFDPAWLRPDGTALPLNRSRAWMGGAVAMAAQRLAATWRRPGQECALASATLGFLQFAAAQKSSAEPWWMRSVRASLDSDARISTSELARQLDLSPAWLAQAYRAAAGEGLQDTIRRRRVALAYRWLRTADDPLAEVAANAGFCDQSHMNRSFRHVLGRTPLAVKREAELARARR